jgi:hypothetical protein
VAHYQLFIEALVLYRVCPKDEATKALLITAFYKALEVKIKSKWPHSVKRLKYKLKFQTVTRNILMDCDESLARELDSIFVQSTKKKE